MADLRIQKTRGGYDIRVVAVGAHAQLVTEFARCENRENLKQTVRDTVSKVRGVSPRVFDEE